MCASCSRNGEAELAGFAFLQPLEKVPAAKGHIAVVAANLRLGAGGDGVTFGIVAQVHRRLAAAFANGLQLDEGIRQRQKSATRQSWRTWS